MPAPLDISPFLNPTRVLVVRGASSRHQVISALADLAVEDLSAHDRVAFVRSTLEREDVTSTGIGNGIALPHARSFAIGHCRIAVGLCPQGIDWGAVDGRPVRVAVLLAARDADHSEHLRVMAALAIRLRRPGAADALLAAPDAMAVIGLLASAG